MVNYILKRYELLQEALKLRHKACEYIRIAEVLEKVTIFKELEKVDVEEANRYKRLHLDSRKEGLLHLRINNGLKIKLPKELEFKK